MVIILCVRACVRAHTIISVYLKEIIKLYVRSIIYDYFRADDVRLEDRRAGIRFKIEGRILFSLDCIDRPWGLPELVSPAYRGFCAR
jgi:hypothetical protein